MNETDTSKFTASDIADLKNTYYYDIDAFRKGEKSANLIVCL